MGFFPRLVALQNFLFAHWKGKLAPTLKILFNIFYTRLQKDLLLSVQITRLHAPGIRLCSQAGVTTTKRLSHNTFLEALCDVFYFLEALKERNILLKRIVSVVQKYCSDEHK